MTPSQGLQFKSAAVCRRRSPAQRAGLSGTSMYRVVWTGFPALPIPLAELGMCDERDIVDNPDGPRVAQNDASAAPVATFRIYMPYIRTVL